MDYDFRNKSGSASGSGSGSGSAYLSQIPIYRPPNSAPVPAVTHSYGTSPIYPKIGHHAQTTVPHGGGRPSPYQHAPPQSSSSGMGIRVFIKPEYRITPPPNLSPHLGDIPRSNFQFDFELERKILAEGEKDSQIWSRLGLELPPANKSSESSPSSSSSSSMGSVIDPVVRKYVASGLNREAVPIAVANYGDNPTKVGEFVTGYTLLREMGFSASSVPETLLMYDNDAEKALAHFLNGST